jgi:S1-C subfamily serine protease
MESSPYPGFPPPEEGMPPAGQTAAQRPRRRTVRLIGASLALLLLVAAFVAGCSIGSSGNSPSSSASNVGVGAATVAVPPAATDLQQTVINVIHTVQPSVVEVVSTGGQGQGIGSGDIITTDGYIVTNDHVVTGFSSYTVNFSNGKSMPAQLIGEDPHDDLAVLKVASTGLRPIAFADSSKLQVGQFNIAIGSPLGFAESATLGIVSALNRPATEAPNGPATQLIGLIQTSAPINPGNSGGALVDLQGQLIGIPTLGAVDPNTGSQANGIGFAIPSNRVKFVTQQLIQNGKLTNTGQGFLGVRGTDVTPQLASAYNLPVQSGFLVTGFANDAAGSSPAQQAGIQTGDIIVAVNGQQITSNADLATFLLSQSPGTKVTVTVQRGNSQQKITVTLGEYPPTSPQG